MKTVTINADALKEFLDALDGPSHIRRETQLTITAREQMCIDLVKGHMSVITAVLRLNNLNKSSPVDVEKVLNDLWQATQSFEKILDQVFK